jgi:hypothetical protein
VLASQLTDTLRISAVSENDQNIGIDSPDLATRRRRRGSSVAQSVLQLAGIRYGLGGDVGAFFSLMAVFSPESVSGA